ncbi:MAG: PAS domain-containing sensor histidine kinase, partial [Cyanobacteria bacterium]|nr:PAS domain-containing sensor histidine kinase [Cyanobacteriota bacterium]
CVLLAFIYLLPEPRTFVAIVAVLALLIQFASGHRCFAQIDEEREQVLKTAQDICKSLPASVVSLEIAMAEVETAFRETLRKEKSVVENAADVICLIDTSGIILSANPASKAVLGYAPEELVGTAIANYFDGNAEQSLVEFLGAKESINKIVVENRFKRKDGEAVDLLWSAHWSASDAGLFCVAHDVSQRKAIEAAKQQLLQMRDESSAMRQKLIDIIVHDIRSPLASLLTTQALLLRGAFGELQGERMRKKVEVSQQEVERVIAMINDLLKLSRYDPSKAKLQKQRVHFSTLIANSVESLKSLALENSVSIETELVDAEVELDEGLVIQVFETLLTNAIRFSPAGETVSVAASRDAGAVKLTIRSAGFEISPGGETALFLPYNKLDGAHMNENHVIGVGLSICREIIESHGGNIGVSYDAGAARTCFFFSLPLEPVK